MLHQKIIFITFKIPGNSKKHLTRKCILIAGITEFLEGVRTIDVEKSTDN